MYTANDDVIETDIESELILLDPGSGEMFSLNETGRHVWRSLPFDSPGPVVAQIESVMDVDTVTAEQDVRQLLARLVAAGLVRATGSGASGG